MEPVVYRVLTVLGAVVGTLPVGTNRALLDRLRMLLGGHLSAARGAVIPALSDRGWAPDRVRRAWAPDRVRRAWAALGRGAWRCDDLLAAWAAVVAREGRWRPHRRDGDRPAAVDVTGFWRPRLRACPTKPYDGRAGKALPAIPLGIVARIGSAGTQRLGRPLGLVRADPAAPGLAAHTRALLTAAAGRAAADDVPAVDRGVGVAALQAAKAERYVARPPQNGTARRRTPPPYPGRGRPATRGAVVRPVARTDRGQPIAATPPDAATTWTEDGVVLRAEAWADPILPATPPAAAAAADAPGFAAVAVHEPRQPAPWLLASTAAVAARAARALDRDRRPVEHLPLAAKQLLGAGRQSASAPATCQRLPEGAGVAGAVLSYLAATTPAPATGVRDRQPRPTPGRRRRLPAAASLSRGGAAADASPQQGGGHRAPPDGLLGAAPPHGRRPHPGGPLGHASSTQGRPS